MTPEERYKHETGNDCLQKREGHRLCDSPDFVNWLKSENCKLEQRLADEIRRREAAEYYIHVANDDRYSCLDERNALKKWQFEVKRQEGKE